MNQPNFTTLRGLLAAIPEDWRDADLGMVVDGDEQPIHAIRLQINADGTKAVVVVVE